MELPQTTQLGGASTASVEQVFDCNLFFLFKFVLLIIFFAFLNLLRVSDIPKGEKLLPVTQNDTYLNLETFHECCDIFYKYFHESIY